MSKITLTQALTGKSKPVKQLPWQYTCWQCGRDNGMAGGPPLSVRCDGYGCDAVIEAAENPLYIAPISMMTLQRADNDTCGNG